MQMVDMYRQGRERMLGLAAAMTDDDASLTVPACPEWTVKDIYAHMAGVVSDIAAGRLDGVATDPWTARQVEDRADRSLDDVCAEWVAGAPLVDQLIVDLGEAMDPRLFADVWTHEQDVRGAIGQPGARDEPVVAYVLAALVERMGEHWAEAGLPVVALAGDSGTYRLGTGEPVATVTASDFEFVRLLLGRRTVAQVAALDWTGDPSGILDHLHIFGPAQSDVVE